MLLRRGIHETNSIADVLTGVEGPCQRHAVEIVGEVGHGELATDAINDQASMDALLETIGS